MLDTTVSNAPALRQAFCIKTFPDRDNWMRSIIASDLSCTEKVIAIRLVLYLNVTHGRCDPAIITLASQTGTSRKTVQRAIGKLEAAGWLKVTRSRGGKSLDGNGYTHSFRFLDPNGVNGDAVDEGATASNEAVYRVNRGEATASNEAVYRVTGDAQTERTAKRTERTAKDARARFQDYGHKRTSSVQNPKDTPWPEGFSLQGENLNYARQHGFDPARANRIFDKFKFHHQARGHRRADWNAAWRGWVVEQVDRDAKARASEGRNIIDGRL